MRKSRRVSLAPKRSARRNGSHLTKVLRWELSHSIWDVICRELIHGFLIASVRVASWNRIKLDKAVIKLSNGTIDILRISLSVNCMLNIEVGGRLAQNFGWDLNSGRFLDEEFVCVK